MRLHRKLLGRFSARYMSREFYVIYSEFFTKQNQCWKPRIPPLDSQAAYTDIKHLTSGHQALLCCSTAQRYVLSRNHLNCLCSELFYFFSNLVGGIRRNTVRLCTLLFPNFFLNPRTRHYFRKETYGKCIHICTRQVKNT